VLRTLIANAEVANGIVFCNRKSEVDVVARSLKRHGFDAAPIHGDLDQSLRTKTLEAFRNNELKLLVASDVAARGLDIPAVTHVFNYDTPHHADDYVHRIGRTGRAGRKGEAFTIVTPNDAKNWDKVVKLIGKSVEEVSVETPASEPAVERSDRSREETPAPRRARTRRPREETRAETLESPAAEEVAAGATDSKAVEVKAPEPYGSRRVEPRPEPRERSSREPERAPESQVRYGARREVETEVVGFGADTPSFLLRTSRPQPLAPDAPATPVRRRRTTKARTEEAPADA
jgi:superfamily II DNA/RNA helicase